MRIDSNLRPHELPESNPSSSANSARTAAAPSTGLSQDQAQVSAGQARVQVLVSSVKQQPEVRQEKVASLRRAVQGGHYQVSDEQMAAALMAHMVTGALPVR